MSDDDVDHHSHDDSGRNGHGQGYDKPKHTKRKLNRIK
jgi:hypothetical protein